MEKINRLQYPELNLILWDVHCELIDPRHAFSVYESRWHYVDQQNLTKNERLLIEALTQEFGHGCFLPAQ